MKESDRRSTTVERKRANASNSTAVVAFITILFVILVYDHLLPVVLQLSCLD